MQGDATESPTPKMCGCTEADGETSLSCERRVRVLNYEMSREEVQAPIKIITMRDVQSKGRVESNTSLVPSGNTSFVAEGGAKKSLANDEV